MDIKITKNTNPKPLPDESKLGFGSIFTDHMFIMKHNDDGWYDPQIVPYGPIALDPAASVFHYGGEVFEGLKAYRTADGTVQLFRPDENAKRFVNSADRMGMPHVEVDDFVEAVKALVKVDERWVPHKKGNTLYIRPFLIAVDPNLTLHGIHEELFLIILSPSGSYFADGLIAVKGAFETEDVRAVRGGTGFTKCGGNYGAANRAIMRSEAAGFPALIWLDGVERKYIEEVGGMNVMFKIDGKVYTPVLNGSILPGITRKSMIQVMQDWGVEVIEKRISVDELIEAAKEGKIEEVWGVGTAAVISPISSLTHEGVEYVFNNGEVGAFSKKLYDTLTGLQWGEIEDTYGWIVKL
jgi:branched-chain amino acid aminotransferase